MRDLIIGIVGCAALIGVMAGAEGHWRDILREHDLFPRVMLQRTSGFISEADIPAEPAVWHSCCSHEDCLEAYVRVAYQDAEWAKVAIADFPIFDLETKKILRSKNGKSYFCRADTSRAPDTENTRCVFISSQGYVKRWGQSRKPPIS